MSWLLFKILTKYWPILANFPKKSVLQTKSIFTDLIVITGAARWINIWTQLDFKGGTLTYLFFNDLITVTYNGITKPASNPLLANEKGLFSSSVITDLRVISSKG